MKMAIVSFASNWSTLHVSLHTICECSEFIVSLETLNEIQFTAWFHMNQSNGMQVKRDVGKGIQIQTLIN